MPENAVEFGVVEADDPSDGIYLYMREPRLMGTNDRVQGIAYMVVTRRDARRIVGELQERLDVW